MKLHKEAIRAAIAAFPGSFKPPTLEYVLENNCKADFYFPIQPSGSLFVEDDDGARAINNLVKYWPWIEKNPSGGPWHLIHVVEQSRPAQLSNLQFLAHKMETANQGFRFHLLQIENWSEPAEIWLPRLRNIVESIVRGTCEQAIAVDRAKPRAG